MSRGPRHLYKSYNNWNNDICGLRAAGKSNGGPGNHSGPGGFGNDHTVVLPVLPTYSLVTIKKFFKRDYLTPAQQAWWDQNPALATQIGQFLLQNHLYGFTQTPELPEDVALMVNAI